MSADVIPLVTQATSNEPDLKIVEMLRAMLERAERGEIRAIAIATVDGGSWVEIDWNAGNVHPSMILGGVARMQSKMIDAWDDR